MTKAQAKIESEVRPFLSSMPCEIQAKRLTPSRRCVKLSQKLVTAV